MPTHAEAEVISRRGELLANLLLTELGAQVTQSPAESVDFLAFFGAEHGQLHVVAVEVKSSDKPLPKQYRVSAQLLERARQSNVPVLLLVVDVKQNRIGFAWLDELDPKVKGAARSVAVELLDSEADREALKDRLSTLTPVS